MPVGKDVIAKEIKNFDTKKVVPQDDILVRILKLDNESIETANFPNELKYANINPVYKKTIDMSRRIIGPVSTISALSKIVEHCLYDQIYKNIENALFRHQMGYRRG